MCEKVVFPDLPTWHGTTLSSVLFFCFAHGSCAWYCITLQVQGSLEKEISCLKVNFHKNMKLFSSQLLSVRCNSTCHHIGVSDQTEENSDLVSTQECHRKAFNRSLWFQSCYFCISFVLSSPARLLQVEQQSYSLLHSQPFSLPVLEPFSSFQGRAWEGQKILRCFGFASALICLVSLVVTCVGQTCLLSRSFCVLPAAKYLGLGRHA